MRYNDDAITVSVKLYLRLAHIPKGRNIKYVTLLASTLNYAKLLLLLNLIFTLSALNDSDLLEKDTYYVVKTFFSTTSLR